MRDDLPDLHRVFEAGPGRRAPARQDVVVGRLVEDALDFDKTARVALEAVTRITDEIALIALVVAVAAAGIAFLLRKDDLPEMTAVGSAGR